MLTKLGVRNFKRFSEITVDLDSPVVLSGRTTPAKPLRFKHSLFGMQASNDGTRKEEIKRRLSEDPESRSGAGIWCPFR